MDKKTPLYDRHVSLKGRIVPFGGYLLPVQYEAGVIAEHMAVRTKAGLFDVSHMGEVVYAGKDAMKALNHVITNDISDMAIGQARYSPMCNEQGGVVDDLIVYRTAEDEYTVVVNASNREKDTAWMRAHLTGGDVRFEDISEGIAQVALQGPLSEKILRKLADETSIPKRYYTCVPKAKVAGRDCLMVSRTGYTGETGFEIYCEAADAESLWDALMQAGAEFGILPCGLGARDTLRLEAAMPLYGHELSDDITPLEADLEWAIDLSKEEFPGIAVLKAQKQKGVSKKRVGLEMVERGIPRQGCEIRKEGQAIGAVTSGSFIPTTGKNIAMAYVAAAEARTGNAVDVVVRGKPVKAVLVSLPFYKKKG